MWFDGQAEQFDDWAGLEPSAGRAVAQAVLDQGGAAADDLVLDVGPGTGAIGCHFSALPCRYLGLERSWRMLDVFRQKLAPCPSCLLFVLADADRPWPVGDGAAAAVFASRVVHHLDARHFVRQVFRVCRPGGYLLLGRVARQPDSLPSRLQRQKRTLLSEQGRRTRGGGQAARRVLDECTARGATGVGPVTAARWARTATARQFLTAWQEKPGMDSGAGGEELSAEGRAAVVKTLTDWAASEFGDLDRPHAFAEEYTLEGVRLP
jgi:SAM-dependent methyltransferase